MGKRISLIQIQIAISTEIVVGTNKFGGNIFPAFPKRETATNNCSHEIINFLPP